MRGALSTQAPAGINVKIATKRSLKSGTDQSEPWPETGILRIAPAGDLVINVEHELPFSTSWNGSPSASECSYRVDSSLLRASSPYFQRLLDPDKFEEGRNVAERLQALQIARTNDDNTPTEALPQISLSDVGRVSVKSIRLLLADFFSILHNGDIATFPPPLVNVANLAIVADRFDALPAIRAYCKSRKLMNLLDAKSQDRTMKGATEERVRQRLLVGVYLDNPSWVWSSSVRLIQRGWVGHEVADGIPLWWDMPTGIEEELLCRREYILDTIQSLQSHFLGLYTSRDRQCKFGYDSSAECDIYQLGQMVRFFKRVGTLSLAGAILAPSDENAIPESYDGEIMDLIDSLRQCPEYQVDKNHSHCGMRTRLMPLLELIEYSLTEVGVCTHCWQECRHEYAWKHVKQPLSWKKDSVGASMFQQYRQRGGHTHLAKHLDTRDLFMAKERLWT